MIIPKLDKDLLSARDVKRKRGLVYCNKSMLGTSHFAGNYYIPNIEYWKDGINVFVYSHFSINEWERIGHRYNISENSDMTKHMDKFYDYFEFFYTERQLKLKRILNDIV